MVQIRPGKLWALTATLACAGAGAAAAAASEPSGEPGAPDQASSTDRAGADSPARSTTGSAVGQAPRTVVAIDPGHGGTNLGAAGPMPGIYEKRVTLALGERIRALLDQAPSPASPPITVVLCRDSDVLVPIRARARCARESGARLFISLHANAVPAGVAKGARHGFEVFVLGPREVEDDAALATLAQSTDADAVWAAHEVRAAGERSVALARLVAEHMSRLEGNGPRHEVRQSGAALDVLRGTGTAAALVEVGFIDHPQEGARLASADGREPIARALASAIRAYVLMDTVPPVVAGTARR